jgi:hypothetical protein
MTFSFETIYSLKILFEALKFWNVQTTTDGKTTKIEIYDFVVDNFFIRNHL